MIWDAVSSVTLGGRAAFHGKLEENNILNKNEIKNYASYGELPKVHKRSDDRKVMLT